MNRIETGYGFPEIDKGAASYFEEYEDPSGLIYAYGFRTIPEARKMLADRLETQLSDQDILECAKTIFRNRPVKAENASLSEDRQVVDFIYRF